MNLFHPTLAINCPLSSFCGQQLEPKRHKGKPAIEPVARILLYLRSHYMVVLLDTNVMIAVVCGYGMLESVELDLLNKLELVSIIVFGLFWLVIVAVMIILKIVSLVGINGRPEKLNDVCYSMWVISSLILIDEVHLIDKDKLAGLILGFQSCVRKIIG
ncbi:hypothetical protein MKW98_011423 [Papaver atlanticum]|uniref:Prenyltransferase alpha-alpha toroid domain-containing protein n=1 Tax=Papaver atlanticum TaxID=357466 RepID=A0AAD4SIK8_9MAGN|nr:hypothetical protein MKW98_011423 [Papaver atlanticum]